MLAERLRDGAPVGLLDVRDEVEGQISQIAGARVIPLGQLSVRLGELDPQAEWVVFCRTGVRSARAADLLRKAGFARVLNLRGGINAWAQEVDSSLYTY
jgi:adenylyltransferase/sulfurtransferase